jgi:hypothetical protein
VILLEHRTTGEGILVDDTDGYDIESEWRVVSTDEQPTGKRWHRATQSWVERSKSPGEETRDALEADPRWRDLRAATPAQIEAWLAANTTNLAQARQVLKLLVLAVQLLARTRSPND